LIYWILKLKKKRRYLDEKINLFFEKIKTETMKNVGFCFLTFVITKKPWHMQTLAVKKRNV
jgi:hypothetical protein